MTLADQIERQARAMQLAGAIADGPDGWRLGADCADALRRRGQPLSPRQLRRVLRTLRNGCGCDSNLINPPRRYRP